MKMLGKFRNALASWMTGRHGADHLGMFTLLTGLVFSVAGSMTGLGPLTFLGFVLYVLTLFRMFSRNLAARVQENRKYLEITGRWSTKSKQFYRRIKNRKEYKYFKCPGCRQLLRLQRGCGEKQITCPKCGHQFSQNA